MRSLTTAAVLALSAGTGWAEVPKVATDIAPVASLVAMVMGDLGTPSTVLRPGASPHGYAMRPSEAQALENADLVVWVGPGLTPWLDRAIDTLAEDAAQVELSEAPNTVHLTVRSGARFDPHVHEEAEHDDHDDHAEEGHDHDHDHDHEDAHDDSGDPHLWLDPVNGAAWLTSIAAALAELDPENADTYRANAEAGATEIAAAQAQAEEALAPYHDTPFIVFHDAYQYFEARMGLATSGAIALGDATEPGPARVAEIQATVRDLGVACVFSEPQFNPRLVSIVTEGTGVRVGQLDPLGAKYEPGAGLYPALIRDMAADMVLCLGGE